MKDFLLLSCANVITYKGFFPLIKENTARAGYTFNKTLYFETPEGETKKQTAISWFTTLTVVNKPILTLTKTYNPVDYPKYDNYDAIEVSKVSDIPFDYAGVMGVPISFLHKYSPTQFEIVGHEHDINGNGGEGISHGQFEVNGKGVYKRLLIRKQL